MTGVDQNSLQRASHSLIETLLPTPNLSCGVHNPHGPLEWVTRQDMEKCLEVLIELVKLWEERGEGFEGYPPSPAR